MTKFEHSPERPSSFPENFVNPETTTLREMIAREKKLLYIPRKHDIERLKRLADLGRQLSGIERSDVRVLDIGGGHGFMDKLLADECNRSKTQCRVIDVDIDQKILEGAKQAYGDTHGLQFVKADAEKEGAELFPETFDLVIASWPKPKKNFFRGEYAYGNLIHHNKPPLVVWIGDIQIGDLSCEFETRGKYIPLAEWYGRYATEVETEGRMTQHGRISNPKHGENLFTVYVRSDIPEEQHEIIKQSLLHQTDGRKYRWEAELDDMFPQDSDALSFDVEERKLDDE